MFKTKKMFALPGKVTFPLIYTQSCLYKIGKISGVMSTKIFMFDNTNRHADIEGDAFNGISNGIT